MTRIVIVGAGYAGVLAANRVAGRLGKRAQVTLINDGAELVNRIRLHEAVAGRRLRRYPLRRLVRRRVEVVVGRATGLVTEARVVEVAAADGLRVVPYDL